MRLRWSFCCASYMSLNAVYAYAIFAANMRALRTNKDAVQYFVDVGRDRAHEAHEGGGGE